MSGDPARTPVIVGAAVIEQDGRYLVTRRHADVHLGGMWEFPGGKCEPGESLNDGLRREIREELGTDAAVGAELLTVSHQYSDRQVELHFMRCTLAGTPVPILGQEMRWISGAELPTLEFPPADAELIALLSRP